MHHRQTDHDQHRRAITAAADSLVQAIRSKARSAQPLQALVLDTCITILSSLTIIALEQPASKDK